MRFKVHLGILEIMLERKEIIQCFSYLLSSKMNKMNKIKKEKIPNKLKAQNKLIYVMT